MKTSKKLLALTLAVLMVTCVVPFVAGAYSYNGFDYRISSNDKSYITKYTGSEKDVVIPTSLSYTVTGIDADAFVEGVKRVTIPSTVGSINSAAFRNCTTLTGITVDSNNSTYCDIYGVLYNKNKTNLICCPCGKKGVYNIPEGVTTISDYAFYNCADITAINIPESVTSIGKYAFYNCTSLLNITVDEKNTKFHDVGGVLYDTANSKLVWCPGGKTESYEIPEGVASIDSYAFRDCKNLIGVTIPTSITEIADYTFRGCETFESLTLPEGVTDISDYAFADCTNLKKIIIPASVQGISIWAFENCESVTIHGYEETTAQYYAEENDIPFEVIKTADDADVFVFKIDDENIYYANEDVKFTAGTAATFDENKKTIVPLRAIAAATGVSDLKYDAATKKITFTGFDGYSIEMQTGSTVCKISKGAEQFEMTIAAPYTKDGSAMLPLRDTTNLVGGYVKYSDHYIVVSNDAVADEDIPGYIDAYNAK